MTKEERRLYNREYYQKHRQKILADQSERRHRYSVPRQMNSHGYYSLQSIEAAYEQRRERKYARLTES